MKSSSSETEKPFEDRLGDQAADEWAIYNAHTRLSQGFSLLVFVVPDKETAQAYREEIKRRLADQGQSLAIREYSTPDDLKRGVYDLRYTPIEPDTGATWVEAFCPQDDESRKKWFPTYWSFFGGLNMQRNSIMRQFPHDLIMCVEPWVMEVFRDNAPDTWSIRRRVFHFEGSPPPTGVWSYTNHIPR
jgi:hypothetical protein